MLCSLCGRPSTGPCPGCRTVSRIRWLWSECVKGGDDTEALTALRSCAGVLTDLSEARSAYLAGLIGPGGSGSAAPAQPPTEPKAPAETEKEDKVDKRPLEAAKETPKGPEVKKESSEYEYESYTPEGRGSCG